MSAGATGATTKVAQESITDTGCPTMNIPTEEQQPQTGQGWTNGSNSNHNSSVTSSGLVQTRVISKKKGRKGGGGGGKEKGGASTEEETEEGAKAATTKEEAAESTAHTNKKGKKKKGRRLSLDNAKGGSHTRRASVDVTPWSSILKSGSDPAKKEGGGASKRATTKPVKNMKTEHETSSSSPASTPPLPHPKASSLNQSDGAAQGSRRRATRKGSDGEGASAAVSSGEFKYLRTQTRRTSLHNAGLQLPVRYATNSTYREDSIGSNGKPPSARHSHAAVLHEDTLLVFGGDSARAASPTNLNSDAAEEPNVLGDTHLFHFGERTWRKLQAQGKEDPGPCPRLGHTLVVFEDAAYLFGGYGLPWQTTDSTSPIFLSDLWKFSFESERWEEIKAEGGPSGRRYHSAVTKGDCMFVFGGVNLAKGNAPTYMNDLYRFSFVTQRWEKAVVQGLIVPIGRCSHTMTVYKNSFFVFGGFSGKYELSDFWQFAFSVDGSEGSWQKVASDSFTPALPSKRGHTAALFHDCLYVIGGASNNTSSEIYEYNFDYKKWSIVRVGGDTLPARLFHTMTLRKETFFIFGGCTCRTLSPGSTSCKLSNSIDYLSMGKDEFEEDAMLEDELGSIPQEEWESVAMRRHPEILELRERLRPLSGAQSFSLMRKVGKTEARTALSQRIILLMIMEHLQKEGCLRTLRAIEESSGYTYTEEIDARGSKDSRLMSLLQLAHTRLRLQGIDLWDPFFSLRSFDPEFDYEVEQIEHLPGREKNEEGTDVLVWEERPDCEDNIVKVKSDDGITLCAGTLNKLIAHLVPEPEKPTDFKFMQCFINTLHGFTTPEIVVKKLVQRYNVPIPKGMNYREYKGNLHSPIAKRVCNVFKFWLEACSNDFRRDDKLLSRLNSFIHGPLTQDGFIDLAKVLQNTIATHVLKKEAQTEVTSFAEEPPEPKVPMKIFSMEVKLQDIDEEEVARQMTLVDMELFKRIAAHEFLHKAWLYEKYHHKAPNLRVIMQRYKDMQLWVATEIYTAAKPRKAMDRFIKIAKARLLLLFQLSLEKKWTFCLSLFYFVSSCSICKLCITIIPSLPY
ncbi:Ras guanine nucleotide exchange factor F [Balamuthia mandrillaris]